MFEIVGTKEKKSLKGEKYFISQILQRLFLLTGQARKKKTEIHKSKPSHVKA